MFGCFGCLDHKKKTKKRELQKQTLPQEVINPENVPKQSENKQNEIINSKHETQVDGFKEYKKQLVSYMKIINPVFNTRYEYKFPSPYIRYKIIPYQHQKQAMDVTSSNEIGFKRNNIIRYDYHGGPNQIFFIKEKENNKFYIISVSKGYTLQVPQSSQDNGVQIIANPRNDLRNQLWQLIEDKKDNTFQIKSFCGKYLTYSTLGTNITQQQRKNTDNQKWLIVPS